MRGAVLTFAVAILLAALTLVAHAAPKPKVAVAPIAGEGGAKVADAIVSALAGKARVVSPTATGAALDGDDVDERTAKKLMGKLGADAVIAGSIERDKKKKKVLVVVVYAQGAKPRTKSIPYKSADDLKDDHGDELAQLVAGVKAHATRDDDDDARPAPKKKPRDRDDDDRPVAKKRRARDDDGDDDRATSRRKRRRHDDDDPARTRALVPAYRVDAGATFGVRRLTYDTPSTTPPPTTGTGAPSGRIAVALFPFASGGGAAAGLGLYGGYDQSFALSITVPGGGPSVPIDQGHYWVGARYRFAIGEASALGFGLAYDARRYVADRSGLQNPNVLDTPDCDYKSLAPGAWLATRVTPSITFVAEADALLLLSTGAITSVQQYGHATAYGLDLAAGIDVPLTDLLVARFAAQYGQVSFAFDKMNGANQRGVTAATDRQFGAVALLGATF